MVGPLGLALAYWQVIAGAVEPVEPLLPVELAVVVVVVAPVEPLSEPDEVVEPLSEPEPEVVVDVVDPLPEPEPDDVVDPLSEPELAVDAVVELDDAEAVVEPLDVDAAVVVPVEPVVGAALQVRPGPQGLAVGLHASPRAARWQMLPPSPAAMQANWVPWAASPQQSAAVAQASPSLLQVGRCEVVHTPPLHTSAPQQVPPELQSSPSARHTALEPQLARQ